MEDALELSTYLPLSYISPKEQEYIAFLWDAFETNYEHEKYQFAFLAYHMLTMSFRTWVGPEQMKATLWNAEKNLSKCAFSWAYKGILGWQMETLRKGNGMPGADTTLRPRACVAHYTSVS
jgi:hypothetical protein